MKYVYETYDLHNHGENVSPILRLLVYCCWPLISLANTIHMLILVSETIQYTVMGPKKVPKEQGLA